MSGKFYNTDGRDIGFLFMVNRSNNTIYFSFYRRYIFGNCFPWRLHWLYKYHSFCNSKSNANHYRTNINMFGEFSNTRCRHRVFNIFMVNRRYNRKYFCNDSNHLYGYCFKFFFRMHRNDEYHA
jgi:hypothetical protein